MSVPDTNNNNNAKAFGIGNLTKQFGKITLSTETREFLSTLDGELVATFSGGATAPTLSVRTRSGELICSIAEFEKLGGYRRWVNDELKRLDKTDASDHKVRLVALFLRAAREDSIQTPERMTEPNEAKFRDFFTKRQIIAENLEIIGETIDNSFKSYLRLKGGNLIRIYDRLMLDCMRSDKITEEVFKDAIFEAGIPTWLAARMVSKQFVSNTQSDCTTILFPKGNYHKAISLTNFEIKNDEFLKANKTILKNSGSIIILAKMSWETLVWPHVPDHLATEVYTQFAKHPWVLNSPYTSEEILEVRAGGKKPPVFRPRQKTATSGKTKSRPETEVHRICRDIYNIVMEVNTMWLDSQHMIFHCNDPVENFWSKIIPGAEDWVLKGPGDLYKQIIDSCTDISAIRELTNEPLRKLIAEMIVQSLSIPLSSPKGKALFKELAANETEVYAIKCTTQKQLSVNYTTDIAHLEKVELGSEMILATEKFLGKRTKTKKKTGRNIQANVRLTKAVLTEIAMLENHEIYENVKGWLASFKTGKNKLVQFAAAQVVAGEVLKYQNKLLGVDFDEAEYLSDAEDTDE